MFFGTYFHKKDSKNRIRIPSKFSDKLGHSYFIGRSSVDGAIAVYGEKEFVATNGYKRSPFNSPAEKAWTIYSSSFFYVSEDGEGRLLLTEGILRKLCPDGLEKDIVSIGVGDHINIMSKSTYDALNDDMSFEDALKILDEDYEKHAQQSGGNN